MALTQPAAKAEVIGSNDRKKVSLNYVLEHPALQMVGRLEMPGTSGTASLVGEDLILTVAHVVVNSETGRLREGIQFRLGIADGKFIDESSVTEVCCGTYSGIAGEEEMEQGSDWAILRLSKPLGKKWGYFGLKSLTEHVRPQVDLMMAGCSPSFHPLHSLSIQESLRSIRSGRTVEFDGDTALGDSGGPLYYTEIDQYGQKRHHIVGVITGYRATPGAAWSTINTSLAIDPGSFMSKVIEMRRSGSDR